MLSYFMTNGVSKADFNKLTMFEVEYYCEGMLHKQERAINEELFVAYVQSLLISQAVWGSKNFPSEPPKVDYFDRDKIKTKEESLKEIENLYNFLGQIAK